MKKLLLLSGLAASLLAAGPAAAQYYLVASPNANRNPGNLNTDDEYPVGGGLSTSWTTLFTGTAASYSAPVWTPNVTIPFAFQFNGQAETSFKVATSGVLTFTTSATAVPPVTNTSLPSAQIPDKSICIWGMGANAGDYIVTKTFGTAPNRQFWVMFNSYSKPGSTLGWTYWSIVLEETTNRIYMVDQRANSNTGLGVTVGVQINATSAVQVPASPNIQSLTNNDASPADNTFYAFNPGTPPARDLEIRTLNIPSVVSRQNPIPITGSLFNLGTQAVTSYSVNYQVNNGTAVSGPVTGVNINSQANGVYNHPTPWQPSTGGTYRLKVWLSNPNGQADQNPSNDTISKIVFVGDSTMRRKVVEESFTSSTCNPCRPGNANVQSVNAANPGKFVVIRYQQNFPAPGTDPYASAESIARFRYYGLNAIPYMMLDGGWQDNSNSLTSAILNQYQSKPSVMRVGGTYSLTGNTVSMNAFVRPFLGFPAGRLVAHMVITERRTVLNARTNGETEFHDVMKKMMPDQNGTPLPALTSGQRFSLPRTTFDVSTLPRAQAVEHFDSLRVVVFVQDVVTKEVYQGEYLTLLRPTATRNPQTGPAFSLAPNPAHGRTTLFVTPKHADKARVEVLDVLGRQVFVRENVLLNAGGQQVDLDLSRLGAGLYTVRLTSGEGVSTGKLTLE